MKSPRTIAVIVCSLIAAVTAGGAIAQDQTDQSVGQEASEAASRSDAMEAAIDGIWRDAAERAEAGELNADVNQTQAAMTLRAAINPPQDVEAANELEDDMIALTEKLRASGDLPQLSDEDRFGGLSPSLDTGGQG